MSEMNGSVAGFVAADRGEPGDADGRPRPPVTVKGVCVLGDGRVLLCRNHRGEWELPGGRPEPGERHPGCLRRELREETGLAIEPGRLLGARPFEVLPGRWVEIVAYACTCAAPARADVAVSDEHTAVAFLDVATLPRDALPEVYRELVAALGR
jgi:8-oxo-dGTP diphosphatase